MLDLYKEKQSLFYEEVKKSLENNKLSHAYLIETNNYEEKDDLILNFIKEIFSNIYIKNGHAHDITNIHTLIDNNTFSDFIIIEPDGAWIKKDQILELQEKFKTTSYMGGPRIYWIKQADKLNKQASNSLLKFLEEPDGNIIAILEVCNRSQILETLLSRCRVYSLNNKKQQKNIENIELLIDIIKTFEQKKNESIAYLPIVLDKDYHDKNFWMEIFTNMIEIYENAVRKKINVTYYNYDDILDFILKNNDINKIIKKIKVLIETVKKLEYNLNITMMLDQFIINFSGSDNYE